MHFRFRRIFGACRQVHEFNCASSNIVLCYVLQITNEKNFKSQISDRIQVILVSSDASRHDDLKALNTHLLFLLRDFDTDQLKGKSPTAYLSEWLSEVKNASEDPTLTEQNNTRASVKALFHKWDCLTMAPPGRKTTNITERELDEEFKADLETLKKFIKQKIKPISVNDHPLNGPELADFVKQAVTKVNDGTPLLVSVVQSLARQRNQEMITVCADKYAEAIGELGVIDSLQMFERAHIQALQSARTELQAVSNTSSTLRRR